MTRTTVLVLAIRPVPADDGPLVSIAVLDQSTGRVGDIILSDVQIRDLLGDCPTSDLVEIDDAISSSGRGRARPNAQRANDSLVQPLHASIVQSPIVQSPIVTYPIVTYLRTVIAPRAASAMPRTARPTSALSGSVFAHQKRASSPRFMPSQLLSHCYVDM
jgi:hypothetical protein